MIKVKFRDEKALINRHKKVQQVYTKTNIDNFTPAFDRKRITKGFMAGEALFYAN